MCVERDGITARKGVTETERESEHKGSFASGTAKRAGQEAAEDVILEAISIPRRG